MREEKHIGGGVYEVTETPERKTTAGLALAHAHLTAPPLHIPDGHGGAYKTELVIFRSPGRTEKINWWHGPDPRRHPHNHPWDFESTILAGALTMTLWRFGWLALEWSREVVTYGAGTTYKLPADVFHTVDAVEPGTVTHMVCGPLAQATELTPRSKPGEWGHLIGGCYHLTEPDPAFMVQLRALNPHLVRTAA